MNQQQKQRGLAFFCLPHEKHLNPPCFPLSGGASLMSLGLGSQTDVPPVYGFSIQCRVTSEDPEQNFQVGEPPGGPGGWITRG